jgi:hypothetical protein
LLLLEVLASAIILGFAPIFNSKKHPRVIASEAWQSHALRRDCLGTVVLGNDRRRVAEVLAFCFVILTFDF